MTGGPPGATITVTKYSDSDGMFGSGYVEGSMITKNITLDASGNYTDSTQTFPVAGIVHYQFKFSVNSNVTRTRYGLFRNPDRDGLAYWTTKALAENLDTTSIGFRTLFFKALDDDRAIRHLTGDKTFDATTGSGCGFYDDPPTGSPTSTRYGFYRWPDRQGLAYWVTQSLNQNFVIQSSGFYSIFFNAADASGETRHLTQQSVFDDTHAPNAPEFRDQPSKWGGPTRYGLWQYPDRESLKNATDYSLVYNLSPGSIQYRTAFFTYMDSLKRTRHLTQDKQIDNTNTGGGFYDVPEDWSGATRWALYQYPDHEGLAYWTTYSLDRKLDPSNVLFRTEFFNVQTDRGGTRHLTPDKIFWPENNGSGFRQSPTNWNQGGSGNITGLTCAKKYKIEATNGINVLRLVEECGDIISTTIGNVENLVFYAEKKKPNPNLTEVIFKGCWEDCTIYKTHEMVLHNEITWISVMDNTGNEPKYNSRYWKEIKTDQAGFIDNPPLWKGAWTNTTTYPKNSIVSWKDKSWIAKGYIDIIITPLPPDEVPEDWKIVDDPSIYCETPEKDPDEPTLPDKTPTELEFAYEYVIDRPYFPWTITIDPERTRDPEPPIYYSVFPEFPDVYPIEAVVKDVIYPVDPAFWDPAEFYPVGTIIFYPSDTVDTLPNRIPDYPYDPELPVTPLIDFPEDIYVAIQPAHPRLDPRKNPDVWAKLLPKFRPTGTIYPKNSIIAVPVGGPPEKIPNNDGTSDPAGIRPQSKMFIALEPTDKVPKADPNTGTNLRPRTVRIPINPNTNQPAWAELVPIRDVPIEYGGPAGADPNADLGVIPRYNPNGAILKGVPLNSSYWRPVRNRYRREWEWRTYYYIDDVVSFCGVLYKAIGDSIGAVPPYNLGNLQETSNKWALFTIEDVE